MSTACAYEDLDSFVLRWLPHETGSWRDVVRQQSNFSPPQTVEECEEYNFALASAAGLGTEHKPLHQQEMWASLERLRISVREEAEFGPLRESEAYRNSDTRHRRFACGIRSWPAHGINNAKHLQRQPCLLIPWSQSKGRIRSIRASADGKDRR